MRRVYRRLRVAAGRTAVAFGSALDTRWHAARAADAAFRLAHRLQPESTSVRKRLVKLRAQRAAYLRSTGQVPGAIEKLSSAVALRPTAKLWTALGECYVDMGDLGAGCRAYRAAVELDPDNLTLRTSLGRTAARRSLVPFEMVGEVPTLVDTEVREQARAEAVSQLAHVMHASRTRVWTAYWLGRVLESHGAYGDALNAYEEAVVRVQNVDKPWAHHAELAWRFRQGYMERVISGTRVSDARLNRAVDVSAESVDLADAAGFFEATITNNGLLVEGFVAHGHPGNVEIRLNGTTILAVSPDSSAAWNCDFKTTIVHNVVGEFPARSELTVWTGGCPLVTYGGARAVEVSVPDGSERLQELLHSGKSITKKGRWSDAVLLTGERDDVYLAGYDTARRFFDEQLGIKLFLSYGTLLGCHRDGRLIPGDDDFDVSFISSADGPQEFKRQTREIIRELLRGGFDARVAVDGRMFHLRVGDVILDVNPFWFHEGLAWSFDAHRLERDVFEPVARGSIGGVEIYVPARTEAFLADTYGPDWRVPRTDFQHHREKAHQRVLRQARLVPSEVRELQEFSEKLRAQDRSAGLFHGYGDPANPQFD